MRLIHYAASCLSTYDKIPPLRKYSSSFSAPTRDEDAVVARAAFPLQAARAVTFIPRALITLRKVESFGSPSGVRAL